MRSSYREEDVVLLLKDITGLVEPMPAAQRESLKNSPSWQIKFPVSGISVRQ